MERKKEDMEEELKHAFNYELNQEMLTKIRWYMNHLKDSGWKVVADIETVRGGEMGCQGRSERD